MNDTRAVNCRRASTVIDSGSEPRRARWRWRERAEKRFGVARQIDPTQPAKAKRKPDGNPRKTCLPIGEIGFANVYDAYVRAAYTSGEMKTRELYRLRSPLMTVSSSFVAAGAKLASFVLPLTNAEIHILHERLANFEYFTIGIEIFGLFISEEEPIEICHKEKIIFGHI